jgi:hypothetical protein
VRNQPVRVRAVPGPHCGAVVGEPAVQPGPGQKLVGYHLWRQRHHQRQDRGVRLQVIADGAATPSPTLACRGVACCLLLPIPRAAVRSHVRTDALTFTLNVKALECVGHVRSWALDTSSL